VGPGDPRGGVRGPLGGHAVVEVTGCVHLSVPALLHGLIGTAPPLLKVCKVFYRIGLALDLGRPLSQKS
jgi:hypothetical protein